MPERNIDRLQDEWAAAGRYSRRPSPEAQRLLDEMYPPVPAHPCITIPKRTPGGYASGYLSNMTPRILEVIDGGALNNAEIAERIGVSPKYVGKALRHLVDTGQLQCSTASRAAKARYWKPRRAAEAA